MKINRKVAYCVLALTCCSIQQGLMVAVAQEQQPNAAVEQTGPAVTTKSGVIGRRWDLEFESSPDGGAPSALPALQE